MYWLAGLCVLTVTSSTSLQESKGLMLWRFVMVLNPLFYNVLSFQDLA